VKLQYDDFMLTSPPHPNPPPPGGREFIGTFAITSHDKTFCNYLLFQSAVCLLLTHKDRRPQLAVCGGLFSRQLQPDLRRHAGVVEGAVILPVKAGVGEEVEVNGLQGVVRKAGEEAPA